MDNTEESTEINEQFRNQDSVEPPIGWDGKTLKEMLEESKQLFSETGRYYGNETLEMKENTPFEYEQLYSRLRGAMVSARETALNISASPIVREIGELCFQIYTPEGDAVAVSTGIIIHVRTGGLAVKYMIEQDYEHNIGIQPSDIFCNNDSDIGNVHTADVHTIVPIFRDGELIAWADGVTHELDSGGATPGHGQIASSSRYEDGLHAACEKIGEDDEIYQDWKIRCQRGVRTPDYWDLNEKCRLSGCHMIRETVHEIVDDVGVDTFKQFMREAVDEGRIILSERVRERLFPGTYRETSFMPVPFEDEAWKPESQIDMLFHLPMELEVEPSGRMSIDMEGASPPGPHPYNCAEGAMEGALWVSLSQCLLHDAKVNDGAFLGMDLHYPAGSIVNPNDHTYSYSNPWGSLLPAYNSLWKNISRGFFSRGYREEVVAGFGEPSDILQGGGVEERSDEYFPISPFEHSCQGLGASAVRDGLDWGYAMWNPESDMGDIESWELTEKGTLFLGRQIKPNSAGHGKYRGGSGWEALRAIIGSSDVSIYKQRFPGEGFTTSGMSGGYPNAVNYTLRGHETDLKDRVESKQTYPVGDTPPGIFENQLDGDIVRQERGMYFPKMFENYDIVHYQMQGGPGWGDPLERPVEKVKEDVEGEIFTPEVVETVYGVVGEYDEDVREFTVDEEATQQCRKELQQERKEESQTYDEFRKEEREKVLEEDVSEPAKWMYNGMMEQSEKWADRYRSFWDLPDNFTFEEEDQ